MPLRTRRSLVHALPAAAAVVRLAGAVAGAALVAPANLYHFVGLPAAAYR